MKKYKSIIVISFLVIVLPLFVWALVKLNFNQNKKAASGEPSVCIPNNKIIVVTDAYGTEGGICHDIQAAIDAVNGDGYTIEIHYGDYNITNTIVVDSKSNLKITGLPNNNIDRTWLSFNTTNGGGWGIKVTNSSGSLQWLHAEGITPNGLLNIKNSNNFLVDHTKLVGKNSNTLNIYDSTEITISNSDLSSSAGAIGVGHVSNLNIANNKIHNSNGGLGLNSNSDNVTIMGNLIHDNYETGMGIEMSNNVSISHNTIVKNGGNGIHFYGASNINLSNNLITNNTGSGIYAQSPLTGLSAINRNDIWSNTGGNYGNMSNPTGTNGNISSNPLLNATNNLYCLNTGSPALLLNGEVADFMGYIGSCANVPAETPNPTPQTNSCIPNNKIIIVTPSAAEGGTPNDAGCHNIQYAINAAVGSGYTILISPGEYFVSSQLNITDKQNITIKGDETKGSGATILNFNSGSGYNFLIRNSSGTLQWMTIQGGSSNGMISIQNSNDFEVAYLSAYSQTSHTLDIQNSNSISVYNTELQSSAGALEVSNSNNISISNNRIHNSANAISILNSSAKISSNLIYKNREKGISLNRPISIEINSNTIVDNLDAGLKIINVDSSYTTIINMYKNIFSRNLYGIQTDSISAIDVYTFKFNDVWGNSSNYFGAPDQTNIDGNISKDPLFGLDQDYCVYYGSPVLYGLISNGEYMGNRLYCNGVTQPEDDVYFKDTGNTITFKTTDQNPNVVVEPQKLLDNKTYQLIVEYSLQNNTKSQTATSSAIPLVLLANNKFLKDSSIPYSLIANHRDGASDIITTTYTQPANEDVKIEVVFDPNDILKETNELNNTLTFSYIRDTPAPTQCNDSCLISSDCDSGFICYLKTEVSMGNCRRPQCVTDNSCGCTSPSPTPKFADINGDGIVNIIDIGIAIDLYDSTSPTNPRADINGDGIVNIIDIGFIIDNYEW